ncbi:MAG: YybS family protein [Selenomonadaceae bacterium]|jgi:uncharacterized protein YybS (DUF2232 family)
MTDYKIKPVTESGILSAITVVMALIGVYVPVVGWVAALVWPLPIILLIVRHGLRWGLMAIAVSGALMAMLLEPLLALRLIITFAPVAIALGIGYRRGLGAAKLLTYAGIASVAANAALLLLMMLLMNVNPLAIQVDAMKEAFDSSLAMYRGMNLSEAQLAETEKNFAAIMEVMSMLLPLVIVMTGLLEAYINFWAADKALRRLGHRDLPQLPAFSEWRLPPVFLYLYGFGLVGMYWGGTREMDGLYQLSINVNMLASFFGFIQGMSLLQCLFNHFGMSRLVRTVIIIVVFLGGALWQIVAFTGLFDMVFDYRKRFRSENNSK